MEKKAQLNISFAWIFAIIVGVAILSLAIFGVSKFMNIQRTQESAETGKEIDVLLNPLETSFESAKMTTISAPVETRIFTQCEVPSSSEVFGKQKIRTLQKTINQWTLTGIEITSRNKYIFAENPEGKTFVAFSKPFEFLSERESDFPFKIADLTFLFSSADNYCFVDSPENIKEELDSLQNNSKIKNFYFDNCPSESLKICFGGNSGNCSAEVSYNSRTNSGTIEKNSELIYFEGDALMYAGIFSTPSEYECQLKRLMNRAKELVIIYEEKSEIEKVQGCQGNLETDLIVFKNLLESFHDSEDLFFIINNANQLNRKNSIEGECKLW